MDFCRFFGLLYIDQPGCEIDLNDFTYLVLFGAQFLAGAEVRLLFLKRIAIRWYFELNTESFNKRKTCKT